MALLAISGPPASRFEETAQEAARLLGYQLIDVPRLDRLLADEFGPVELPYRAWRPATASVLARLATEHHLVVAVPSAEALLAPAPWLLRAGIAAPDARRAGNLMLEERLERPQALAELRLRDSAARQLRKARFGRSTPSPGAFDIVVSADRFDPSEMARVLASVCAHADVGLLPVATEARMQFETRLELARHKIAPAARTPLKPAAFGHPSEGLFANLLDFYRIRWEYEPRSFPLQWDKDGQVLEAFTPDFYLPEFDQYIELTTMRQALVTRKNRKVKLLRAVYPHVNIQVFYQKDFQDLVSKYGLRAS